MSSDDKNTVGRLVRVMRLRQGLSQQQLADAVGVSKQAIFLYENGKNFPKPNTSKRLSEYFGVPVESFQPGEVGPENETDIARLARLAGVSEAQLLQRLVAGYGLKVAAELADENGITELRLEYDENGNPTGRSLPGRKLRADELPKFSKKLSAVQTSGVDVAHPEEEELLKTAMAMAEKPRNKK